MSGPLENLQAVLAAQGQVLKESAKRYGIKIGFLIVAVVFLAFAAIALHGVLWGVFLELCHFGGLLSAACVLGVDVLLAILFLLLALCVGRSGLGEARARVERDRKLGELRQTFALSTVVSVASGPVGRFAGGQVWRLLRSVLSRRKK